MKIVFKNMSGNDCIIGLLPENNEDLWHAYQLISKGDHLKSTTFRKVMLNEGSSEGPTSNRTSKVRTTLNIEVEQIDFHPEDNELRIRGKNIEENEYVKIGSYHTLNIEQNRKFVLSKSLWDAISADILKTACDPSSSADIAAVVMHEGIANICLITSSMTIPRCKIELNIPRKRKNYCQNHDKAVTKFFDTIALAISRHVDFNVVKVCIIASPGFLKEQFLEHMIQMASKNPSNFKMFADNKDKFILAHSSNGFKSALNDILQDQSILKKMSSTKAVLQMRDLQYFYNLLYNEPEKAIYGLMSQIQAANDACAINTLLVTDEFLRKASLPLRMQVSEIMKNVKSVKGNVSVFSVLHSSGEQLAQLGGIAAILRFPMPELLEMEEEIDDED
ncbi:hypothetical protein GJ496_002397 [Pomphorhynchus laevis]|nr:hypothetical protein GJ496_002397 [Pomphorhynchus laevis]